MIKAVNDSHISFHTNGATEHVRIQSNGRVGIGTTTPASRLHVHAADGESVNTHVASFKNMETSAGDSEGVLIQAGTGDNDNALEINSQAASALFHVKGSGKVGIGDSVPQAKLHVEIASHNDAVGFYNGATALVYMRNESGTGRLTLQGSGGTINLESSNSRNSYINNSISSK